MCVPWPYAIDHSMGALRIDCGFEFAKSRDDSWCLTLTVQEMEGQMVCREGTSCDYNIAPCGEVKICFGVSLTAS